MRDLFLVKKIACEAQPSKLLKRGLSVRGAAEQITKAVSQRARSASKKCIPIDLHRVSPHPSAYFNSTVLGCRMFFPKWYELVLGCRMFSKMVLGCRNGLNMDYDWGIECYWMLNIVQHSMTMFNIQWVQCCSMLRKSYIFSGVECIFFKTSNTLKGPGHVCYM